MKATILGTGSWGSAFARHLAHKWDEVAMWGIEESQVASINATGTNPGFLGDVRLPPNVGATLDLKVALAGAEAVFVVVPSQAARPVMKQVVATGAMPVNIPIVNLAKGLEIGTLKRLSEVMREELERGHDHHPLAVLLGPSHAEEVAAEMPTALVLAGDPGFDWEEWQRLITGPYLRVYTNDDMLGVEITSGFKNVIAVAVGLCDGLGMGDNTRGALLTRGMAELARITVALGGRQETCYGLAGIGDMITTSISRHSRNRNFGEAVARGQADPAAILQGSKQVVEGFYMTQAALKLSAKYGIELPIVKAVHEVLFEDKKPLKAIRELMERMPRSEAEPER
ncbi:MAG: NAD(P)-dependent glycerol-3-phosphate dehydrogenase [Candidatus Krumholzibacteria bacterium]|nr:NAD(P)-dependent glycerol-3-phosphate dehydrogenase [Candidatus Krumholzibacteria bacterium]